ncbi:MAG: murein biosynthesis integral membrane protein MurJ [Deltaproteobacteria bacterium]|nr:murein biosynthesis integral membrane protein MurJ [Deltaproteobacteria bacterium]
MVETGEITRAAGVVGAATLLSRIFGFLRDMIVAQLFGAGMATDAFFVAFRIPNLFRRLVGEGALTASFIPVYSEYLSQRSKEESEQLVHTAFSLLAAFLLVLTGVGIIFSPWIVKLMAYGFSQEPEKFQLTVLLNRLMFPYMFFIGLVALVMGILNSLKHFAGPALAPVLLNISIITCALTLSRFFPEPIISLAIGVVIGGIAQFLFQIPFLRHKGIRLRWHWQLSHPGVKRIGLLMAPSILGLAVTQLNVLVNTLLASYLPEGSISYLYYADRLLEFPMGIFAIAIATAVLPSLSEHAAQKDIPALKETLAFALRLTFFVTLPAMAGLIVLRYPIINLLFQRGAFDAHSAAMTAQALLFYAVGLAAFAGVRIIVPAFYSLQDTQTPVNIAIVALLANAALGALLMFPLQHGGLALATSLSAGLNFALLVLFLRRKLGRMGAAKVAVSFLKNFSASILLGIVCYGVISLGSWTTAGLTISKIFLLLASIGAGTGTYALVCRVWGCAELQTVMELIRGKVRK